MTAAPNNGYIDTHYSRKLAELSWHPQLRGRIQTDVCIVGGGLAGLSLALALAERQQSVALLEARRLAWGASGRNGGFVLPGFSLAADSLLTRMERTEALNLFGLSKRAVELVRQRSRDFAGDEVELTDGALVAWRYPAWSEAEKAHAAQ